MSIEDLPASGSTTAVSYLGGYIFLSYVVSVMGCTTTLELLHRRTSKSGLYNWYLLLTSSITMGGIGIWCMHFIGNRAIVLGNGDAHIQTLYSVTFTGLSFVLPVCVLLAAFYAIGASEKAGYTRIITGGILTGSSVCGMHYVGQMGIENYRCSYRVANVAGSAIIAIFASTVALSIFFRWRATWTDSWWRRGVCGLVLAGAVSGMHWTAAVGTSYWGYTSSVKTHGQLSRSQTVIICSVLACVSCGILSACAIAASGSHRRLRAQAQQVVLTCAFFDPEGRIMVTPGAFLPSRKVVDRYVGRFDDDELTRTHPAFLWALQASANWKSVGELVPFMRHQLESDTALLENHPSKSAATDTETELQSEFDNTFKRQFCVAAQALADEVRHPLQDLGMLYDDLLATSSPGSGFCRAMGYSRLRPRKGQVMFTVHQLKKQEASRLAASGFRFTEIENVTTILSRRVHLPLATLGAYLKDMRDFAISHRKFGPGVHLVSFVMRPTTDNGDRFEVLTVKGTGNPLPSSTLSTMRLDPPQLALLACMEGFTISMCLEWIVSDAARAHEEAEDFREELIHALSTLDTSLRPGIDSHSRFSAQPLSAPCHESAVCSSTTCTLLPFYTVGPDSPETRLSTATSTPEFKFAYTPLRLFRAQQQTNAAASSSLDAETVTNTSTNTLLFSKSLTNDLDYSRTRTPCNNNPSSSSSSSPSTFTMSPFRLW